MTKPVFCANCQADTDHDATIDQNGDLVLTCACGRSIKFPAAFDAEQVDEAIAAHKAANEGQISIDKQLEKFGIDEQSADDAPSEEEPAA
jgi:hypothetical protein